MRGRIKKYISYKGEVFNADFAWGVKKYAIVATFE